MNSECYICNQVIDRRNGRHIYYCAKKHNLNLSKEDIRYRHICFKFQFQFTKAYMEEKYISEEWSLVDFKDKHELDYKATQFLLAYFDINIRSIKESNSLKRCRNKYIGTCKDRYGKENASQVKSVKDKKKETFKKNYGVDNIWKSKEYYKWLHDFMLKKYDKKSLPNKYGNMNKYWDKIPKDERQKILKPANEAYKRYWESLTDEQKNEINNKRKATWWESFKDGRALNYYSSNLESRFAKCLSKANYSFKSQVFINRKSYDFKINDFKILMEIQGDFWHANPEIYSPNDLMSYPGKKMKAKEVWKKDESKRKNAEKYGYKILYYWEKDLKDMTDEDIIVSILESLKNEIDEN